MRASRASSGRSLSQPRSWDAALEKLREDPYLLAADDCGVAFSVADGIAMSMGFGRTDS